MKFSSEAFKHIVAGSKTARKRNTLFSLCPRMVRGGRSSVSSRTVYHHWLSETDKPAPFTRSLWSARRQATQTQAIIPCQVIFYNLLSGYMSLL